MSYRSEAHRAIVERELQIAEETQAQGQDAVFAAIAKDRAARWKALMANREELPEIHGWAEKMARTSRGGRGPSSVVGVYRNRLDWITALYVVRYGEAEDCWPPQLTPGDAVRGERWRLGLSTPDGIAYLGREEE